jgi:hypothetical protein
MADTPPATGDWTPPVLPVTVGATTEDPDTALYRAGFVELVRSFTRDVLQASAFMEDAHTDQAARRSLARDMSLSVLAAVGAASTEPSSAVDSLRATPRGGTTPRRWEIARQLARSVVLDATGIAPTPPPEEEEESAEDPRGIASPIAAREVSEMLHASIETLMLQDASAAAIQSCLRGFAARQGVAVASQSSLALLVIVREELLDPASSAARARRTCWIVSTTRCGAASCSSTARRPSPGSARSSPCRRSTSRAGGRRP